MSQVDTAYPFGTMGKQVRNQIENNFDVKIIVTSHNSKTGLGKTTLSILMAHAWDKHGWSAEEKAFMNAYKFHNAYKESKPGSVLIFDEIEQEADARRAMSSKNVDLTQMIATDRFRNLVSIYTLPAVSMLDNRMMEMADYWVNVMKRGEAHPYKIYVNDFTGDVIRSRIGKDDKDDDGETLNWLDPNQDYPNPRKQSLVEQVRNDKEYLDDMKEENASLSREYVEKDEVDKMVEKQTEASLRDFRDSVLTDLGEHTDLSSHQLSDLECFDLSQQRINQIQRENS